MIVWLPKLLCKNPHCVLRGPIFLPCPTHLGILSIRPDWPTDGWQAFAVCQMCGHGSPYSKGDVIWDNVLDQGIWALNSTQRIGLKCAEDNCEARIEVLMFAPADFGAKQIEKKISHGPDTLFCSNNHTRLRPEVVTSIEVLSDLK